MSSAIGKAFDRAKEENRTLFIPYMMAGYPDPEIFREIVETLAQAGAGIIEIGLPFSDPLADGPVIQAAGTKVLAAGMTVDRVLEMTAELENRVECPLVLMTYYNPVLQRGPARFASQAAQAGVSGLIIPDLPPEEAASWLEASTPHGLETVFMAAPTTTPGRLEKILELGRGFVYYASLTGVTGSNLALDREIKDRLAELRKKSALPVAVGFGVSSPAQAGALADHADGVIVGTALIRAANRENENGGPTEAVRKLARGFVKALEGNVNPGTEVKP